MLENLKYPTQRYSEIGNVMLELYFKGNYQKWYDEDCYEFCLWLDEIETEYPILFDDNWKLILVKNNALNDLIGEMESRGD